MPKDEGAAEKAVVDAGAASDVAELIGKRLGNFVISRVIGQGGMGAVLMAEHPALGKQVAVKFLSRQLAVSHDMNDRFLGEARMAASLQHPNIVDILDFGELDDRPYYVMELLHGMDLAQAIKQRGRFGVEETGAYLAQIAAALDLAHGRGVIHRDLKPANVFVLKGSPLRIKLLDFGIAKSLAPSNEWQSRTQSGQILGTPTHMAPEQVLGSTNEIGPHTDLYALGAILYEMLTGKPVFEHHSAMMLMMMHVRDAFTPLRDLVPEVPEHVARTVERCLSKVHGARQTSAGDVLRQFLDPSAPSSAPPPTVGVDASSRVVSIPFVPPNAPIPTVSTLALGDTLPAQLPAPVMATLAVPYEAARPEALPAPVLRPEPPRPVPSPTLPSIVALPSPPSPSPPPEARERTVPPIERSLPAPAVQSAAPAPLAPLAPQGPEADDANATLTEGEQATLGKLLRRMQSKGDFPAFMTNVTEISRKAQLSSSASAGQLADTILKDYALTAKLLRVVNSSYYERFGKKVSNVSRAVVVLGFEQIRSIALSISIHKNPGKKPHADELAELSVNALISGEIARKLAPALGVKNAEEAHVCAMFRNLGHQLVAHYLSEDYEAMQHLTETRGISLDAAATQVLGVSLRKLSMGVMQKWRMSPRIAASMAHATAGEKPRNDDDRLKQLSAFSNELCATVATTPAETRENAIAALLDRYKGTFTIPAKQLPALLSSVHDTFKDRYATLLNLDPERSPLLRNAKAIATAAALPAPGEAPSLGGAVPTKPAGGAADAGAPDLANRDARAAYFEKRLAELEAMMREPHDSGATQRAILQAFATGFRLRRTLLLAPGKERGTLRVLAAWGEDAKLLQEELVVPMGSSVANDVFSVAWHSGQAVVMIDALDEKSTTRVPRVYYEFLGSVAFALYPCGARGPTPKLLMVDTDSPGSLPAPQDATYVNQFRGLIERSTIPVAVQAPRDVRPLAPKRI